MWGGMQATGAAMQQPYGHTGAVGGVPQQDQPQAQPAAAAAPKSGVVVVFNDENYSMEERRAMLPRYSGTAR
mgnify:CR=1 FL=1